MHRTQFDHARLDISITRKLITFVMKICHVKVTQTTATEEKRLDFRTLSSAEASLCYGEAEEKEKESALAILDHFPSLGNCPPTPPLNQHQHFIFT